MRRMQPMRVRLRSYLPPAGGASSAPATAPPPQACAPLQVARARRLPGQARALAQYSHLQR